MKCAPNRVLYAREVHEAMVPEKEKETSAVAAAQAKSKREFMGHEKEMQTCVREKKNLSKQGSVMRTKSRARCARSARGNCTCKRKRKGAKKAAQGKSQTKFTGTMKCKPAREETSKSSDSRAKKGNAHQIEYNQCASAHEYSHAIGKIDVEAPANEKEKSTSSN